jgi:hypothetical protein
MHFRKLTLTLLSVILLSPCIFSLIQFFYQQLQTQNKTLFYSFISIDLYPYTCFSPWTIFRGLISYYTTTCMLEGPNGHTCLNNKF